MPVARKYVQNWEQMKEKNIGLLIWGDVGCGKSFLAGAIANALIDQEVRVKMTNFTAILNDLSSTFEGRNEYLNRLCSYPLLIIDDFGMERGTEYGLEQVYSVIDGRYRSKKPLIVTTNLTLTELRSAAREFLTGCWTCVSRFSARGKASGKRPQRKNWKRQRVFFAKIQTGGDLYWQEKG